MKNHLLLRIAAIAAALILVQTLFFKFTGHADSVALFSQLGVEPYGRIGLGVVELIAAILLVIPKTRVYGSILGLGLMAGALMTHFAIIGIEFRDDGGTLFALAVVTFVCSAIVLYAYRDEIPVIGKMLTAKA